MPPRCFLGCPSDPAIHLHLFPNHARLPEQFHKWVEIVGGQLNTPEDFNFFHSRRLCDRHFKQEDHNRNNRLNALAIPSLFLRAKPGDHFEISSTQTEISMETPLLQTTSLSVSLKELATFGVNREIPETMLNIPLLQLQAGNKIVTDISTTNEPTVGLEASIAVANSTTTTSGPVCQGARRSSSANVQFVHNFSSNTATQEACTVADKTTFLEHNYSKFPPKCKANTLRTKPSLSLCKYRSEQRQINNLKKQINSLRKRCTSFKNRLASASKISAETAFQKVTKDMTSPAKLFTRMQITQTHKKPSGRRFTLNEKVLSLSLFKRSPKCYSFLSHCFTLPSKKTLKAIMAQIKLGPGINDKIFERLKKTVSELSTEDRLCSVIFDEMSLTPQITYDIANDKLNGFVSKDTNENENQIANHVLVFMVKGIKANYKQPVAYYFTNSLNRYNLKRIIIEVITNIQGTGLVPLCSICDQSSVNVGAISDLLQDSKSKYLRRGKEWRHDFYEINKQKIIPLYDVPHLLKGLRNNLLTKDLIYTDAEDGNKEKVVKWKYFQQIYEADKTFGELRLLHKITEEHINPEKIKKMRVKTAAQIFSHSVAVAAEHLTARGVLHEDCRQVIPIVSLIDNLFDSLNSSTFFIPNGKIYKACVRKTSPHYKLWRKAKLLLKSIKFVSKKKTGDKIRIVTTTVPTSQNFVKTIEGFEALWDILSKKYSLDAMLTRNLNQDPIENFFGNIRSYGARYNSPNTVAFEGTFKALLLNNFNSPHAINSNCEKDENNCLQTLDFFLTEKQDKCHYDADVDIAGLENITICETILEGGVIQKDLGQRNYVCGWVLTKCLKMVKGCAKCKENFISKNDNDNDNDYIQSKEYKKKRKWLVYPSKEAVNFFFEIQHNTTSFLKENVLKSKRGLRSKIIMITNTFTNFQVNCDEHNNKITELFIKSTVNILITSWCRNINRILSGKASFEGDDIIKTAAQVYYNKHKNYKNNK